MRRLLTKTTKRGVPLTRENETKTEAQFFSMIRSHARRLSIRWKPRAEVLKEVRRVYKGLNKRQKWEYQCNKCKQWFAQKQIEVDHIIPCGSIKCFTDIGPFYERMLVEKSGYQVLCKPCHLIKSKSKK